MREAVEALDRVFGLGLVARQGSGKTPQQTEPPVDVHALRIVHGVYTELREGLIWASAKFLLYAATGVGTSEPWPASFTRMDVIGCAPEVVSQEPSHGVPAWKGSPQEEQAGHRDSKCGGAGNGHWFPHGPRLSVTVYDRTVKVVFQSRFMSTTVRRPTAAASSALSSFPTCDWRSQAYSHSASV